MRLTSIEIRDYRSLFADETGRSFRMDLGSGMNSVVGRNNCGKSNVLRAVSLALDPNHPLDALIDNPGPRPFAHPVITLRFAADGERAEEVELLRVADAYERDLGGSGNTLASDGEVVLQVAFQPTPDGIRRRELLLTRDEHVPATPEQEQKLAAALAKLRAAVRFVLISSGESIESVLEGNFREILHSVVRERLQVEFDAAEESRGTYVKGLEERLLGPLRDRLAEDIGRMFPEIEGTHLSPDVPSIDMTLSKVGVSLDDLVSTPLSQKGTGVRGGVLVAMLSYLALNATRGMVFAVEEPEAFLHPAAQEDLREQLEQIAASRDVTLLVTSHSPHIVTTSTLGRVFCLAKDREGRTRVAQSAAGDAAHAPLIGDLFRERTLEELLTAATQLPASTKGVLLVEGEGDERSLRLAASVVGRSDLLEGLHIRPCGGTKKIVVTAVVSRAASPLPTLVMLDNDGDGIRARDALTSSHLKFQNNSTVMTLATMFPSGGDNPSFGWEIEDLYPPSFLEAFVAQNGESIIKGKKRRPADDGWHYDFDQSAKELLGSYFEAETKPEHVGRLLDLILLIRAKLGFSPADATAAEMIETAHAADTSPPSRASGGAVLVIPDVAAFARANARNVLLLPVDQQLPDDLTHVGFYADAEIKPHIPRVVADYQALLIDASTIRQLRETGKQADLDIATILQESLDAGEPSGMTRRVLLLSEANSPNSLTLPAPVQNDIQVSGKPFAWTATAKVVRFDALAREPATTTELAEFQRQAEAVR